MARAQGALFLCFGIGILLVIWQSLRTGWLPCGTNGLRGRLEFRRDDQPAGYWTMFALYGVAGFWLLVFGVLLLVDRASPLALQ